jgi:pimeloyl-ACP methyl ester carboxylesterase
VRWIRFQPGAGIDALCRVAYGANSGRSGAACFCDTHLSYWLDASDDLLAAVRLTVSSVRPAVIASRIRFVLACDVRKQLGDIAVPMLYIQANQDRLIPGVCVKEIHRIKPEMAVKAIDGPHLFLQREPQRTAEMVAEFVRQLG